MSNPFGCPYGVFWLIDSNASDSLLRNISFLGPDRVRWRGDLTTAPHWGSDHAWTLDGRPATIRQIMQAARVAA